MVINVMKKFVKAISLSALFLVMVQSVSASPEIQHWETSKGAKVYFVPSNDIPMVDLRIVFDAGSARDEKIPGTAVMTNGLLAEGAAGDSAQVLAEKFETVGAQFGNGSLKDMAWLSLRSLREDKYLRPALKNLQNILIKPDFPKTAYQRELERLKISVKAKKQSPNAIASDRFFAEMYGNHPYASPSSGTEESLQKLNIRDLKSFYEKYYVASNAVVSVVGQLTRAEAEELVNNLFAQLPAGNAAKELPEVLPLEKAKTIHIDFPSVQSTVMMGQVGVARGDADYFSLYLANHAFGGSGFGSRLMEEVREKRGLAYSTYSYFSPMHQAGPFQIGLQTRNDQVDEALKIIRLELGKYVKQGPGEDELQDSLKNITGGFPLRIDSNKKITEYLSVIGFYDLPLDYLNTFVGNINNQNTNKVIDALKRRIDPQKMLTVIVGAKKSE